MGSGKPEGLQFLNRVGSVRIQFPEELAEAAFSSGPTVFSAWLRLSEVIVTSYSNFEGKKFPSKLESCTNQISQVPLPTTTPFPADPFMT